MLKDIAPKGRAKALHRARRLRSEMSLPEVLLWQALRRRPGGIKFRRQHPSGPYILDFFCIDARLAVEIDGAAHSLGDRPSHDERRDAFLVSAGIATLRVPASAVLADQSAVVAHVIATASARLPLHHAAHGPPPRDELGED